METSDDDYLDEDTSSSGGRRGVIAREVLTGLELDLAYSSEKVPNLEILLMQVTQRANDYEALTMETEDISTESLMKALEFDLLSGILNSEIREIESFMASIQIGIADARQKNSQNNFSDEASTEIEGILINAEETIKRSRVLVADIRKQSEKIERTSAFCEHEKWTGVDEETENCHLPPVSANWKLQSAEQQRYDLQLLEKSLARELDLEKKLSDSRCSEEELKIKLNYAEHEAYCMGETMEIILERMFEAENAVELFVGISKELAGKVASVQFDLNGALSRECQMKSQLHESLMRLSAEELALKELKVSHTEVSNLHENTVKVSLKEAEEKCVLANSEVVTLRKKVTTLEEKLRECESQLQLEKASVEASHEQKRILNVELDRLKNVIEDLRENILKLENRAESAEAKCILLTKTNKDRNEELGFFSNNGTDKAIILERKLQESDTQLEHAKVSVEAIEERQNVLYSALGDMENLIEDLKGKVSKAESKAESAESRCTLLTETNSELNEELGFLRGRYECLETSLHQADDAKLATAKDIGIRTKIITDLVVKLSVEREHLQLQVSALTKTNRALGEKCLKTKDCVSSTHKRTNTGNEFSILKVSKEAPTEISTTELQASLEQTIPAEDDSSRVEAVSTVQVKQVEKSSMITATPVGETSLEQTIPAELKYLWFAFFVALVSFIGVYLFQNGNQEA